MVYTDGCHKKETNLAGAGICGLLNGQEILIRVRPSKFKPSPVHNINRAELIAMYMALQKLTT